jgi:hypothetical protein
VCINITPLKVSPVLLKRKDPVRFAPPYKGVALKGGGIPARQKKYIMLRTVFPHPSQYALLRWTNINSESLDHCMPIAYKPNYLTKEN